MDDDWLRNDEAHRPVASGSGAYDPISEVEYERITAQHEDAGYRDGITRGKIATLQEGFDSGYAIAVPLARDVGRLRGAAAALLDLLLKSGASPDAADRTRRVVRELGRIAGVQDFDEARDREAEAHAKEHADAEAGKAQANQGGSRQAERRTEAATELEELHESVPPALRDQRDLDDLTGAMGSFGGAASSEARVDGRARMEGCRLELQKLLEETGLPIDIVAPEPTRPQPQPALTANADVDMS